jgi:hypothetical protein
MMMVNQAKLSDMLTVTVTRDAWDWLVAVATLIVAPLSLIALVVGFRALHQDKVLASNADDALVRERRSTFELAILARILELCALSQPGAGWAVRGLLLVLPTEDLPSLRAKVLSGMLPSNEALAEHMEEYKQAVDRRLHAPSVLPLRTQGKRQSRKTPL